MLKLTPSHPSKKVIEVKSDIRTCEFTFSDSKSAKEFYALFQKFTTKMYTVTKLARFFGSGSRETREALQKRGILQCEAVFGNNLKNLTSHIENGGPYVPQFVQSCIAIVEMPENIGSVGIYRTSGNLATVQKIRLEIDKNNYKILDTYAKDCDVITGSHKMFYRELSEPLITQKDFEDLNDISSKCLILSDKIC